MLDYIWVLNFNQLGLHLQLNLWLEILGQQLNLLEVFQILMLNLGLVKEVAISLCPYQ